MPVQDVFMRNASNEWVLDSTLDFRLACLFCLKSCWVSLISEEAIYTTEEWMKRIKFEKIAKVLNDLVLFWNHSYGVKND